MTQDRTESTHVKTAQPDHPIHELIARRWSPYGYAERSVTREDLRSLLEAARWAPSSYNEQPWSFIVATKDDAENHARVLSCLVEPNQTWAKAAPVLALSVASLNFTRNGKPNAAAQHDVGLAAAHLTLEATARGLVVHQMIGIVRDRAREVFAIPEGHEALTALAIGYAADASALSDALRGRDTSPRTRKPLAEFVYGSKWGEASALTS